MKKSLILCFLLAMFASVGSAFADDHDWDNGGGNNDQRRGTVDEGGSHQGDEAQ